MPRKSVRMTDIAQKLGISTVTVSKVLNGKEGVGEELRLQVMELAESMGYQHKDKFKNNSKCTIGIIIGGYFLNPAPAFYWSMYEQVVNALRKIGYYSILEIYKSEGKAYAPEFVTNDLVSGIIVIGQVPKEYLQLISNCNLPLVMLDFYNEAVPGVSVLPDNMVSTYKITNYLLRLGHKDIGFVGNIYAMTNIMDRYLGYYKALLENDISIRSEWIISDRDDMTIFQEYELPEELPTAFVCNCDQTAYWLVKHLQNQGYKVPDDISVVGFYNYAYATMSNPKLTTVNVDMKNLANIAADSILNSIEKNQLITDIILNYGSIIERNSVKSLISK